MNQIVFTGSERSETSMGVQENVQTVKYVYQAFSRGDVPGFLALMAEDVVWHVPGTYAISGTYQGHEELVRWLQRVARDFARRL
jgi:ketosteroid isomerase-like protein